MITFIGCKNTCFVQWPHETNKLGKENAEKWEEETKIDVEILEVWNVGMEKKLQKYRRLKEVIDIECLQKKWEIVERAKTIRWLVTRFL